MLLGKYRLEQEIGHGGTSKVYLAYDREQKKYWAIKEIPKYVYLPDGRLQKSGQAGEVRFLQKLYHPALPHIVDVIDRENSIYLVMDYVSGENLDARLKRCGPQRQEDVIAWGIQLCRVLIYLHTQSPPIIYRDMKPANIILCENQAIRLVDFGIARAYDKGAKRDTVRLGTIGFCAPEQYSEKRQSDARSDIYSLGITLYTLLTGHNPCDPPYELCPIRQWKPELSPQLETILIKATQKNPKKRYQDCTELLQEFLYLNHPQQ